jgi:hypothetical protein
LRGAFAGAEEIRVEMDDQKILIFPAAGKQKKRR